jgi:hypothetical protein
VNLSPTLKSVITLATLTVLLVIGAAWGFSQATKPFPGRADPPICVDTAYEAGDRLYPQDVTVSVINASTRLGLAGRTLSQLGDEGFHEGETANAADGTDVARAEIWTTDADSAAVLLVRSRFGQAEVVEMADPGAAGIVVVVGDNLADTLFDGRPSILTETDIVVCGPEL